MYFLRFRAEVAEKLLVYLTLALTLLQSVPIFHLLRPGKPKWKSGCACLWCRQGWIPCGWGWCSSLNEFTVLGLNRVPFYLQEVAAFGAQAFEGVNMLQ